MAIIATPDLHNMTCDLANTAPFRILFTGLDRGKILLEENAKEILSTLYESQRIRTGASCFRNIFKGTTTKVVFCIGEDQKIVQFYIPNYLKNGH